MLAGSVVRICNTAHSFVACLILTMAHNSQPRNDSELFEYVDSSRTEEEVFHFLGFEFLHRLNMVQIQNDLIAIKEDIFRSRGMEYDKQTLKRLLDDHSKY